MIGAAIEAAIKPLRRQLEATIVPKQHTIETCKPSLLQCGIRSRKKNDMSAGAASDTDFALRYSKQHNENDRVQTRAIGLELTGSGLYISLMPPFAEKCENATAAWMMKKLVLTI